MKLTGITRRIDELGRVVIPKEIRKNMHIKQGELLEIFLTDSENILLRKHNVLNKNDEFLNAYIKILGKKTNSNIFISNLDEIVFSTIDNLKNNKLAADLNESVFNNISDFKLTHEYYLKMPFKIYPISPNGDLIGHLILENQDNNLKKHEDLIKFSICFLENYFEEN